MIMWSILTILLLSPPLLYVFYILVRLWQNEIWMSHFVELPGLPIFKNFFYFSSPSVILSNTLKVHKNYGGIVKVSAFYGISALLVVDNKLNEFILSTTHILNKAYLYGFLNRWLGEGLLTARCKKWKKTRKILTPAFHFQILEQYIEVFNSAADILINKLKNNVDKEAFDVSSYMALFTLDIICETAMGTKVNAQQNSTSEYVTAVREMCRIIINRITSPWKIFRVVYMFSKDYKKERNYLNILHGYTNSVIKKRREELAQTTNSLQSKRKLSFLDLILQATIDDRPLTDEEIRQEVDTIMFEGHDTTASAISFILYCIAEHPEVQNKIVSELKDVVGDDPNNNPSYNDLQNMKYLEMVIKESLRLFPPIPFFGRTVTRNLSYDNYTLPRMGQLVVFAFGVHRDPNNYPNPEKFDPERFTTENQIKRDPFSYLAFSAGPRNCIGQKFALLEMKSSVSKILRNFELLPALGYKPQLVPLIVLKSSNGILIKLKQRKQF